MAGFFLTALVIILLVKLFLKYVEENYEENESKFNWESLRNYDFEIVGESFHQDALERIVGGGDADNLEVTAYLIPESDNKYDSKAVKIEVQGKTVGHLSRSDARRFRKLLTDKNLTDSATTCKAVISGGGSRDDGEEMYYGVFLQ